MATQEVRGVRGLQVELDPLLTLASQYYVDIELLPADLLMATTWLLRCQALYIISSKRKSLLRFSFSLGFINFLAPSELWDILFVQCAWFKSTDLYASKARKGAEG